ncbi:MAG: class D sortase [Chloroflexi bacterium]|nr:class D sortase [Chloroflexota bacterium]
MKIAHKKSLYSLLGSGFMVIGLAILASVAAYLIYTRYTQAQLRSLEKKEPTAAVVVLPESTPTPLPTPTMVPHPPSPANRIVIPSIEVDAPVVELGTVIQDGELVWDTPKHAVGHLKGTAYPGEVGNIAMAGHINSPFKGEGNVFKRLPEINLGDTVTLYTAFGLYLYQVKETKVVLPEDTWVLDPTPEPTLTLITCVPDWVWSHRLIVTARLIEHFPAGT